MCSAFPDDPEASSIELTSLIRYLIKHADLGACRCDSCHELGKEDGTPATGTSPDLVVFQIFAKDAAQTVALVDLIFNDQNPEDIDLFD